MARRAAKSDGTSTLRLEKDIPDILSGIYEGKTTGTPLAAVIFNGEQHSKDYGNIAHIARPAHADFTGFLRYNGANDPRGGGHFSGRLTAPLVFAGAVCAQILEHRGITTGAHIRSLKGIQDDAFDPVNVTAEQLKAVKSAAFPVLNSGLGAAGTFWLYGIICLAGGIFVWRRLPETKGKSLEEIEHELIQ